MSTNSLLEHRIRGFRALHDLGYLLGGAIVVETVFNLQGVGQLAVQSLYTNDFPTVMGVTVLPSLFIMAANLVVDVAYAFLDPRVRYG